MFIAILLKVAGFNGINGFIRGILLLGIQQAFIICHSHYSNEKQFGSIFHGFGYKSSVLSPGKWNSMIESGPALFFKTIWALQPIIQRFRGCQNTGNNFRWWPVQFLIPGIFPQSNLQPSDIRVNRKDGLHIPGNCASPHIQAGRDRKWYGIFTGEPFHQVAGLTINNLLAEEQRQ